MKKGLTFITGFIVGLVSLYIWGQFTTTTQEVIDTDLVDTQKQIKEEVPKLTTTTSKQETPDSESILINKQLAGDVVTVSSVSMSKDGWVVIHEIKDGVIANALGAARRDAGEYTDVVVHLLRAMVPGGEYAVVLYTDNGDKEFNMVSDSPVVVDGNFIMRRFKIDL